MPVDTAQLKSQVAAAFARGERYAGRVAHLYEQYTNAILQLVNSYPGIDPSKEFSFAKYPALQRKVNIILRDLSLRVTEEIKKGVAAEWEEADKVNDTLVRNAFGAEALKDPRYQRFFDRNLKARDAFMNRIDAGGMGLSDRIWKYSGDLKGQMDLALNVALTEGRSADQISRDVRGFLKEPERLFRRVRDEKGKLQLSKAAKAYHPGPGKYRSSYKNAMRVARTETNMAYKMADHTRYQQLDFVVGFEVKLSKSHPIKMPIGDLCDDLDGKYPKDFIFKGWHPQCMCYVTSVMMTDAEFSAMQDKILDGEPTAGMTSVNQIADVPDGFKNWIKDNKERADGWKSQPYFIKENFKGGRIEGGLKFSSHRPK
jgi:hypothetical protein